MGEVKVRIKVIKSGTQGQVGSCSTNESFFFSNHALLEVFFTNETLIGKLNKTSRPTRQKTLITRCFQFSESKNAEKR